MSHHSVRRALGALGATALIGALTACGATVSGSATGADAGRAIQSSADGMSKTSAGVGATTSAPTGTPAESDADATATTTAPAVTVSPGKTGWYQNFAITVEQVTATEQYGAAEVEIALSFENVGRHGAYVPRGSVEVDQAVGDSYDDLPGDEIPSGATGKGTITVAVQPATGTAVDLQKAIDSIVLIWGEQGDNRTLIPLAQSAPVDSVEPRELAVTGSLAQGSLTVDLLGGTLAPSWEPGEEGKDTIDLLIKVSCAADCRASGYYSDRAYFTLADAAGVKVAPDQLRSWYCCEAIYPQTVVQGDHSTLVFLVPEPGTGTWTLTYEDPAETAAGFPPGSITFTV